MTLKLLWNARRVFANSRPLIVCALAALWSLATLRAEEPELFRNSQAPIEARISDLLSRLTLEEKAELCYGGFVSGGVPRLGIGQLRMLDGRQGLRPVGEKRGTRTTLLPCVLALSCTWDPQAAGEFGRVLAEEALALEQHVVLAPMLNLVRSPLGGRNFENFGEDPFLVGSLGAAYIQGVQELGVGACACLLAANDCEHRRHFTSSNMDERSLRELHLAGYEMAVRRGNVWSMMSGNNLLNGVYCAQNRHLIQELMKDEIGFDGVMITDWRAAYDTVPTALAGTDMTTGLCGYVFGGGRLLGAVQAGEIPEALLEEKVRRILRLYIRSGVLDPDGRAKGGLDTAAHRSAARRLAAEGMVLLKNEKGLLPLKSEKIHRVLLTGPGAARVIQGGGSGSVPAAMEVSPLQGLRNAFGEKVVVTLLPFGEQGRARLRTGMAVQNPSSAELARAAKAADVVVFVAAETLASEGRDLLNMDLPGAQAAAISTLAKANPRTVVVLVNNGAVTLDPWIESVSSLLAIHYAGEATGDALADVLTGKVNPAGKLSYTFGKRLQDFPCHALGEWPARLILQKDPVDPGKTPETRKATHAFDTEYQEGVFAGYRWFDAHKIKPWFPFGFGLSYTTFRIGNVKVADRPEGVRVACSVTNTGRRPGAEVVQVYVAPREPSFMPPRELKGYAKVTLQPGETRRVEIALRPAALAFYDLSARQWKAEAGTYDIEVGTSSRDICAKATVTLARDRYYNHTL